MISGIERATGSRVRFETYRMLFLPRPGCAIEKLTLERYAQQPIALAKKVTIQSSWLDLLTFRKSIRQVQSHGLHLQIPSPFPPPVQTGSEQGLGKVVIGEFLTTGAILDFNANGSSTTRLGIRELHLRNVGNTTQVEYATVLDIPHPPGEVKSWGTLGPFSSPSRGQIPVAGSFELRGGTLSKYKGLAGSIDGKGTFQGPLENIRVEGTALAAGFEVNDTGHPMDVRSTYRADVNGLSGDVILEAAEAEFLRTRLSVHGAIKGNHGKSVSMHFVGKRARTEDLLTMFTRSEQPALKGPIDLRADTDLTPGDEPFLRRLTLSGTFAITNATWTRTGTQEKVNSLSARARGDKEQVEDRAPARVDHVLSQLTGDVSLKQGLASLSNVRFQVPGATASGGGTYNLMTKRVDLKGTVSMAADASEATSGWKSLLLKPFDRLFRRKKESGATLPVSITGQYPKPRYRVGLTK